MSKGRKIALIATGLVAIASAVTGVIAFKRRKDRDLDFDDVYSSKRCVNCGNYFCNGECYYEEEDDIDFARCNENCEGCVYQNFYMCPKYGREQEDCESTSMFGSEMYEEHKEDFEEDEELEDVNKELEGIIKETSEEQLYTGVETVDSGKNNSEELANRMNSKYRNK